MSSPYSFDDFMRQYGPKRSVIIRGKLARKLVKLASRVDRRTNVHYVIEHHHPKAWR